MHRWTLLLTLWLTVLPSCDEIADPEPADELDEIAFATTLAPTDDAQVKREFPSTNYGALTDLRARALSGADIHSYLRFDVRGVGTASVTSALLRLYCTDDSPDGGSVFRAANDAWTEGSITFASAPGTTGSALDTAGAVAIGSWVDLDVTAAVTGDGAISFVLTSASSNSVLYGSAESTHPPGLIVTTSAPTSSAGILISPAEIAALPTSGTAWQNILSYASRSASSPDLGNQDDNTDQAVFAKALVYARTGNTTYRAQVVSAIRAVMETENGGRTLALGRNLTAYILAAELVGLGGTDDSRFRSWLSAVRRETLDGRTLVSTHEDRPNNWGTHAGAARIAAARYLGDTADLAAAADVFHGYLGNRSVYAGFRYGADLTWQCDPARPVGINPAGCTRSGRSIDGVLPDDQRRAGSFTWPAPKENYVWEALQGAVLQAVMLERAGYPAFSWQNQALLRAVRWLYNVNGFPAANDDTGTPWLINEMYGTTFSTRTASPGKNGVAFYDWLFGS